MRADRLGVGALVAGSVLTVGVFLFHPSHISQADLNATVSLSMIVHAVSIAAAPLLLFGLWELSSWIGRPLARLGLAAAGIALGFTVNAAIVSAFVTPAAARASGAAAMMPHDAAAAAALHHPAGASAMPPLVQLSVAMNRGLAQAHVGLLSAALLLFGLALWGRSRALSVAGLVVGAGPMLWQASGQFTPETWSMPFVVFPQCAWLIAAALLMARAPHSKGLHA